MKVFSVWSNSGLIGIMRFPVLSLVVLASLLSTCIGALYEDVNDLPTLVYDYIVVGVRRSFLWTRTPTHPSSSEGRCCWQCPRESAD